MQLLNYIKSQINLPSKSIENTIELLKAINTIVKNKDLSQKQIAKFWNIVKKSLETA